MRCVLADELGRREGGRQDFGPGNRAVELADEQA